MAGYGQNPYGSTPYGDSTSTSSTAVTDSFPGTTIDSTKWFFGSNSGDSVSVVNNRARFSLSNAGGYNNKAWMVSKAASIADQKVNWDWIPSDTTAEVYLETSLRAQTQGADHDFNEAYRLEIDNRAGTFSVQYRLQGANTILMSGTPIPGWASNVPMSFEFSVIGTTLTYKTWVTGTTRPTANGTTTQSFMGSLVDGKLTNPGYTGFTFNGGSASVARTVDMDNFALNASETKIRISRLNLVPTLTSKIRVSRMNISTVAPPAASGPRIRISRMNASSQVEAITVGISSNKTSPIDAGNVVTLTLSGANSYVVTQTGGASVNITGSGNTRTFTTPYSATETTVIIKVVGSTGNVTDEETISFSVYRHQVWVATGTNGSNLVWSPAIARILTTV